MAENHIPHDIIHTIFTKLPVKSLFRCKYVCKEWKSHLENPKFIQFHLDLSLQSESNPSLVFTSGSSIYIVHDLNTPSPRATPVKLPPAFQHNYNTIRVVGSCNGLLCVGSGKFLNSYFLCNPFKPESPKILPFAQNIVSKNGWRMNNIPTVVGFGYDQCRDEEDYKWRRYMDSLERPEGMVYSSISNSRAGSWKLIEPPDIRKQWSYCGVLNNFLHFDPTSVNVILRFDLHSEGWDELCLPVYEKNYRVKDTSILRGCLSVLMEPDCGYHEFWVMNEYGKVKSWTRLYTLQLRGSFRVLFYHSTRRHQVLLSHSSHGIVWYDTREHIITEKIEINEGGDEVSDPKIFIGSLVPVVGMRRGEKPAKEEGREESLKEEPTKAEDRQEIVESTSLRRKTMKKNTRDK